MARAVHDPAARLRSRSRAWSLRRRTARNGNNATHDAAGNMTDDGLNYTYVYDAFGRLKTVKTRGGSPVTVAEYTYNGLGHRIGWHYDADADADVDGNDPWYWFFYDERWRMVATYRGSDANPKERFVYHNAGASGYGGSSYIDSVICRESDDSVDWKTAAPDSTLQTRYYYLQNWRADVVALIQADGVPLEYVRYSAYGVPFVYAAADVNRDGQVDILDTYAWDDYTLYTTGDIAVSPDVNRDGATDSADATFISDWDGTGLWSSSGRGFVSRLDSRKGYAGYEFDPATTQWHVRHRVLVSEMGRWGRRDPIVYGDGPNLFEFTKSQPTMGLDPFGLDTINMHCGALSGAAGALFDHCWISCSDGTGITNHYSLLKGVPNGAEPSQAACIRRNDARDTGRIGAVVVGSSVGSGLCRCLSELYAQHAGCNYPYNGLNCNSNWFASSMWACCVGTRFAPWWPVAQTPGFNSCCNRADVVPAFTCKRPGGGRYPGSDFRYMCQEVSRINIARCEDPSLWRPGCYCLMCIGCPCDCCQPVGN